MDQNKNNDRPHRMQIAAGAMQIITGLMTVVSTLHELRIWQ